jgi:AcrR family transcriptional regulator
MERLSMAKSPDEVRTLIINAAQPFFARHGLFKTTIDDIARGARMGKSSLYYYFKNKEEIFRAVLDKEILQFKGKAADAVANAKTPIDKLKTYVLIRMRTVREMANVHTAFKDDYLANYEFVHKIREGYDRYEIELIRGILCHGVATGLFTINDIDLTSGVILTAMKGLEYEWATQKSEQDVERNITKLFDVLFYGIVKR